jgi:hypothetical protein
MSEKEVKAFLRRDSAAAVTDLLELAQPFVWAGMSANHIMTANATLLLRSLAARALAVASSLSTDGFGVVVTVSVTVTVLVVVDVVVLTTVLVLVTVVVTGFVTVLTDVTVLVMVTVLVTVANPLVMMNQYVEADASIAAASMNAATASAR